MDKVKWYHSELDKVWWYNCKLDKVKWYHSELDKVKWYHCELDKVKWYHCESDLKFNLQLLQDNSNKKTFFKNFKIKGLIFSKWIKKFRLFLLTYKHRESIVWVLNLQLHVTFKDGLQEGWGVEGEDTDVSADEQLTLSSISSADILKTEK